MAELVAESVAVVEPHSHLMSLFDKYGLEPDNYNGKFVPFMKEIFAKAKDKNIGIGYTGSGANTKFFNMFCSGSSDVMVFANMPYSETATYECLNDLRTICELTEKRNLKLKNSYKQYPDGIVPFVSSHVANALCDYTYGYLDYLKTTYADTHRSGGGNNFTKFIAISCSADASKGSFYMAFRNEKNTYIYACTVSKELKDNRDRFNKVILALLLEKLELLVDNDKLDDTHDNSLFDDTKDRFSMTKLSEDESKHNILFKVDFDSERLIASEGGSKKLSRKKRRNRKRSSASRK